MEKFTNMTLNPDNTVDVGAACNWDQLYTYLGAKGRGVVGGARHANVGVAGYTLGGGFSVKSSQYGLAMDTVTKYQVVMPNGYILQNVSANAPDEGGFPVSQLFYALQVRDSNRTCREAITLTL
jgi:FAD/FMN-containing dehydrogenase